MSACQGPRQRRPAQVVLLLLAARICLAPVGHQGDAFANAQAPRQGKLKSAVEAASESGAQASPGRLLVLGGNGYVGREVCKLAIARGYQVTSLSRRGENPDPEDELLAQVSWLKGNAAADESVLRDLVSNADAVVHAIGLLFDENSGLTNFNIIDRNMLFPLSTANDASFAIEGMLAYDTTTRKTAFNLVSALKSRFRMPFGEKPMPLMFVSAAEAGWPEVAFGQQVEAVAPAWLKEYLKAKRAVEAELASSPDVIRPAIFRPSLIWDWTKWDVLPVIPIFNLLSAIGVPFVDKTVTVSTLSKAIMAGLEDDGVSGVQRFAQMEELAERVS